MFDVKQVSTGDYLTIDSAFLNVRGEKATIEDLTAVHFKIEWWNEEDYFDEDDLKEEIIILEPVN